jgi:hypothetical protein
LRISLSKCGGRGDLEADCANSHLSDAGKRRAKDGVMSKADDLQQRVETFVDGVVKYCGSIALNPRTGRMVGQLTAAATSIGANYR